MAREIKLNSTDWCDLVFEGKNKTYGAYALRRSSSKRHTIAFGVIILFVGVVSALPSFLQAVQPNKDKIAMDDVIKISDIELEKKLEQQEVIKQEIAPPPLPTRAAIQFTPPTITADANVDENREMHTQEELNENRTLQISIADNLNGSTASDAVSLEDLANNRIVIQEDEPNKRFEHVEQMPQFPGGEAELMKYINNNIKYPPIAAENGIEGRVVVRFVVEKNGKVSDINILRSVDPSLDKEAARVIRSMPTWIPGMQNGRNVAVYYTLPVLFKLQR
ncbi:MAG: energy transducer TonB [Dysgonomonas sp.]|uniref:energy transducer TonB n=1 Tax=Dysgonomonas sp. TaxID=1891233 RepID=UPI0039E633D2